MSSQSVENLNFRKYFPYFEPREEQVQAIEFALNSFVNSKKRFVIIEAGTGCHAKGQGILMYDGSIRNVEDIKLNDLIMGPDSKPRKILRLIRNKGQMVKVNPIKGDSFIVNNEHILTLRKTRRDKNSPTEQILVDVSVSEWKKWSKKQKHLHKIIRSEEINFDNKTKHKIDPYFMGLLLGDGSFRNCINLTTMDNEIKKEAYKQAKKHDVYIRINRKKDNKASSYFFSSGRSSKKKNNLLNKIREYNLFNKRCENKFIPQEYKTSSILNRKKILAGLIDSDGSLSHNCFEIITKSKKLADDMFFIARSLGLYSSIQKCQKASQNGTVGDYYRLIISGDTDKIPTKLKRKKATKRKQKKNPRVTGFSVEDLDIDDFYGFTVDKDNRYLMGDFTITHNCGKSHVAYTIANTLENNNWPIGDDRFKSTNDMGEPVDRDYKSGTWFLTTQKILQNQYIKDFGPPKADMFSLKSSSNYTCKFFVSNNCGESLKLLQQADKESRFYQSCQASCIYRIAKRNFLKSKKSITNFPFFLVSTSFQADIEPRKLLVIDEAHNIEDELSKHIEILVSEKFAKEVLKITMPDDSEMKTQFKAHKWIKETYYPEARVVEKQLAREIEEMQEQGLEDTDDMKRVQKRHDLISKHTSKIYQFLSLYTKDNWVFNMVEAFGRAMRKVEFKPIDIGEYAQEKLFRFGQKILMLSATILNKEAYCESVGIDPEDVDFISIDSPFPLENRQVYYLDTGKMSMAHINETLPNMIGAINEIMGTEHKTDKGIIHSRNYQITKYLLEKGTPKMKKRLITHESHNRDEIIEEFMASKKPQVLVSPSSTEGLDLKGDLSRFQIICKMQFPYMGDELVKKRISKHKRWYAYQTAKALVQCVGRSIRSENDYATTYILDGSFGYFFEKNKDLFPGYFVKSVSYI